jgi:hypothetical protein
MRALADMPILLVLLASLSSAWDQSGVKQNMGESCRRSTVKPRQHRRDVPTQSKTIPRWFEIKSHSIPLTPTGRRIAVHAIFTAAAWICLIFHAPKRYNLPTGAAL